MAVTTSINDIVTDPSGRIAHVGLTDALVSPPPVVWIVVFTLLALLLRGPWLALYTVLAFLLVVSLELWVETMQTLALVLVATVIANDEPR